MWLLSRWSVGRDVPDHIGVIVCPTPTDLGEYTRRDAMPRWYTILS